MSVALLFVLLVTLREALTLGWFSENKAVEAANKQIKEANALYKAGKVKEALELYKQSLSTHKNAEIEEFIKKQEQVKN